MIWRRSGGWPGRVLSLAIFVIPLAVYLRTLSPTITWRHDGVDGGDLIAAVATLGIPHPTGYPTYVLLGRLFLLIPWGDLAYRLNLMSAVFVALTVLLFHLLVLRSLSLFGDGEISPLSPLLAAASGLAFAFSPLFWSQALIAEVYALNAFFVALTIHLLLWWMEEPRMGILSALAFGYGLALGNHLTILLLAPSVPLLLGKRCLPHSLRDLAAGIVPLLLGSCVYFYLPLRALHHPVINWGDPHTLRGFVWLVSGSLYRHFLFALPLSYLPVRLSAWAGLLLRQFGWWGVLLGLVGWWSLWQRGRELALCSSALFLGYSIYAIGYNTTDSHVYLIPAFLLFALWLTWGLSSLLAGLRRRMGSSQSVRVSSPRTGLLRALPLCLFLLIPLSSLVGNFSSLDLSSEHSARDFSLEALASLDPQAILISQTDPHTFALWYFRYTEGKRPDVTVLDGDLLQYEWYRGNVAQLPVQITLGAGKKPLSSQILALIEGNVDRYPIYLTDPDMQVRARYRLSREGPLYRVVGRRRD